jgi:peptidase E
MTRKQQIIALGGGGFSMEEDLKLDRYVLGQSGQPRPKVCFIGTASGDSERYLVSYYAAMAQLECQATHLALFDRTANLTEKVLQQDVIFVGGGNTKSMLGVWREWGLDQILRQAYEHGVLLSGVSAGAICWFEQGLTDSYAHALVALDGLGILPGSCTPHYDGEAERRPTLHRLLQRGEMMSGLAAEDGVGLHYIDGQLAHVVSSRPTARAFQVRVEAGQVLEVELTPDYLGDSA